MKKLIALALLPVVALATFACDRDGTGSTGEVKTASAAPLNPAMAAPDQVAWNIFLQAVTPTDGAGTALETWPSDTDTFKPGAALNKAARDGLDARAPVIPSIRRGTLPAAGSHPAAADAAKGSTQPAQPAQPVQPLAQPAVLAAGNLPPVVPNPPPPANEPGSVNNLVVEEVRRNPSAFNYIVNNNLNSRSGLIKAFNTISQGGAALSFPADAIEVKTNWIPVSALAQYYPGVDKSQFYLATDMVPGGGQTEYALIAMHVISKQVPSWTWATFEHQANPGRCDFMGCRDSYGAATPYVAPVDNQGANQGTTYANCAKTAALQADFAKIPNLNAAFANYCLKGSQTDFIDNGGLAVRVGNSVTENGFVPQASCMTCHGVANFNAQGQPTSSGGFLQTGPNTFSAFVGPIDPIFYYSVGGGQPFYQGQPGLTVNAVSADFVWSIPFCAYDDVTNPQQPAPSNCAGK